ncbi:MAG: septum formation initiator family protein [Candidatus Competibacteraceae bacterium]|nr:septum formation initiator family protein [Candidatus Competibacteraceae bacterium]
MAHPTEQSLKPQILIAVLIAVLIFLHYLLWLAEDGVRQTLALRIAVQAQIEENAALNERNRALEADVIDLKNGLMAIEERARTELGMIRSDETLYRILEEPLPKPVKSRSAQSHGSSRSRR